MSGLVSSVFLLPPREEGLPVYWSGMGEEVQKSARYRWDGHRRGSEVHLVWQFTISGRGWLRIGDRTAQPVPRGMGFLALFPSDHCYYYQSGDPPWRFIWVSWTGPAIAAIWQAMSPEPGRVIAMNSSSPLIEFVRSQIRARSTGAATSRADAAAAFRLLLEVSEPPAAPPARRMDQGAVLPRLNRVLERHPDVPVGKNGMASQLRLSRFQLYRAMKSETGAGPKEWTAQQRLLKAIELLKNTTLSVADVAVRVGLPDANYFARFFRRRTGFAPRTWRSRFASGILAKRNAQ